MRGENRPERGNQILDALKEVDEQEGTTGKAGVNIFASWQREVDEANRVFVVVLADGVRVCMRFPVTLDDLQVVGVHTPVRLEIVVYLVVLVRKLDVVLLHIVPPKRVHLRKTQKISYKPHTNRQIPKAAACCTFDDTLGRHPAVSC